MKIIDIFLDYGVKHKVQVLPLVESIYESEIGSLILGLSIERKGTCATLNNMPRTPQRIFFM